MGDVPKSVEADSAIDKGPLSLDKFVARYGEKHSGLKWDGANGVDGVRVVDLPVSEMGNWDKIVSAVHVLSPQDAPAL